MSQASPSTQMTMPSQERPLEEGRSLERMEEEPRHPFARLGFWTAIAAALGRAKAAYPRLKAEVEADTLEQVDQALEAGADLILLDNMNPVQLRLAVQKCKGRALTEASGGVTLATVPAIADTGVDFISVGALTHSARAVDIGLDFEP